MKIFTILVQYNEPSGAYSAAAMGAQGDWSRNLNGALESLLNKLLQGVIFGEIKPYVTNQEISPDVTGPTPARIDTAGNTEATPSPKARRRSYADRHREEKKD